MSLRFACVVVAILICPQKLADSCMNLGAWLAYFATDKIFSGGLGLIILFVTLAVIGRAFETIIKGLRS